MTRNNTDIPKQSVMADTGHTSTNPRLARLVLRGDSLDRQWSLALYHGHRLNFPHKLQSILCQNIPVHGNRVEFHEPCGRRDRGLRVSLYMHLDQEMSDIKHGWRSARRLVDELQDGDWQSCQNGGEFEVILGNIYLVWSKSVCNVQHIWLLILQRIGICHDHGTDKFSAKYPFKPGAGLRF